MKNKSFIGLLTLVFVFGLMSSMLIAGKNYNYKDKKGLRKPTDLHAAAQFDVNRISSWIINDGLFANDPPTGYSGLEYPKGSGNMAIYTAGMWLLGLTSDTHELRACAACYSTDLQPGKILDTGAPDDPTKSEYIVYKYNKGDVVDQVAIDQGCPAEVIGDQMLFCVYNDANPSNHTAVWQTPPIGLEVRETVWGYNQAGPLGDCMFMKFEFINKGVVDLDSAYVAIFFDPDLGEATDDYVACDTDLSIGYVYNGTAHDPYYGYQPPAIACDFFQGPLTESPGDTAFLPSGTFPDMKVLPMTAFVKYINSNATFSDPSLQTAEGGNEAYNYVRGFVWDGSPFIDPTTGTASKFVNSGDPVKNTGWLGPAESTPGDMRMVLASGPFSLKKGEPMEVVAGIVAGVGTNYLNSISVMKYNDKVAQFAYDSNWKVGAPPPQPQVTLFEGDKEFVLSWDNTARDYKDEAGYEFEGYNIWQAPSVAGDKTGKWNRIATFDKANFITKVWDEAYDPDVDETLIKPVQFGTDHGLQYSILIEQDALQGNTPLINGKKYYFAVTGYTYNAEGTPKSLENGIIPITVVPHKPELKTELAAGTEQEIEVAVVPGDGIGAGDISATVTVVDPSQLTGHDYRIDFVFAESGPDSGFAYAFKITDVTTSTVVVEKWDNIAGLENDYPIFDGLMAKVIAPTPGAYGINVNVGTYGSYGAPYGGFTATENSNRWFSGTNGGLETFWGGMGIGENFFGSSGLTPLDYVDVTIHFVKDQTKWQKAYVYARPGYAFKGVGTFPGWAEDVSNPSSPRQINLAFVENDASAAPDLHWDPIAADAGDGLGGREYLFIMSSDYAESGAYDDDNWAPSADVLYAIWPTPRGDHTSDEEFDFTIHSLHPTKPGDNITFSSAGLTPVSSTDIAKARLDEVKVFPNPYFGINKAETSTFSQFVNFINLPADECTIRIFTLSGRLINTINHTNGTSLDIWKLTNSDDIPVASGMYLAYIEIPNVGEKVLKLAVINRQQRFLHAPN